MIVYTNSFGRLGNQLWTHAHLLALAIDRNVALLSKTSRAHDGRNDGNESPVCPSERNPKVGPATRPLHGLNWRAEESYRVGPAIPEPDVSRDFKVFDLAGFGRFATHFVNLANVVARHGRWN